MPEASADEQDLAKVLDSVADTATQLGGSSAQPQTTSGLSFEETAAALTAAPASPVLPPVPSDSTPATSPSPSEPTSFMPSPSPSPSSDDSGANDALSGIKKDALNELRPLVDKLNVSAEEKFDTYLLLIRSTDDTNLIAPAHEAAKAIEDEARRAEALLDIVKEIDFLSQNKAA
jgi:hypothetical protein